MSVKIEVGPQQVPLVSEGDVVVVGGGPAGIAAAISAARNGAKTILVERYGFVGGLLACYLPPMGILDREGNQVVRGIFQEITNSLRKRGACSEPMLSPQRGYENSMVVMDTEAFKYEAQELLTSAGVDLHLHSFFSGVLKRNGGAINVIVVQGKSGPQAIGGKQFIDCSGDADLAVAAGVPFSKGSKNGEMQMASLTFVVGNVDRDKLRLAIVGHPEIYNTKGVDPNIFAREEHFLFHGYLEKLTDKARSEGSPRHTPNRLGFVTLLHDDEVMMGSPGIPIDGTDVQQLSRGEIEARRWIFEYIEFLREWVSGFENACLRVISPQIGIRETRRVKGQYTITGEDVVKGRRFPDEIALGTHSIDIKTKEGPTHVRPEKVPYGIPYRCLVPLGVENLLVAGRCISATRKALASTRVTATCMAEGEAAGCAASRAVASGRTPATLDVKSLREQLKKQGAYLSD